MDAPCSTRSKRNWWFVVKYWDLDYQFTCLPVLTCSICRLFQHFCDWLYFVIFKITVNCLLSRN
jgi:hypothetical protein